MAKENSYIMFDVYCKIDEAVKIVTTLQPTNQQQTNSKQRILNALMINRELVQEEGQENWKHLLQKELANG